MFIKLSDLHNDNKYIVVYPHPMGVLRTGWEDVLPIISEVKVRGNPEWIRGIRGGGNYGFHKSYITPIFNYDLQTFIDEIVIKQLMSFGCQPLFKLDKKDFITEVSDLWVIPISTTTFYEGENQELIFGEGENFITGEGRFNSYIMRKGDNTLICKGDSNILTCSNRDNVLVKGKLNRIYCFGEDNVILLDDSYNSVSTMNTTGNVIIVNSYGNSISVVKGSNVVVLLGNKNHVNVIGDYNTVINVGKENILNTCH